MDVFRAKVAIQAKREDVWVVFTDPRTWEAWYGGVLQSVDPAWQAGAKLIWKMGPPSTILDIVPQDHVVLHGGSFKTTWKFSDQGGQTLVEMEKDFRGGTLVVTDPSAQERMANDDVAGLKKYIEGRGKSTAGQTTQGAPKTGKKWYQFWK